MAQDRPGMAQDGLEIAQRHQARHPKDGPRWAKIGQDGPKMSVLGHLGLVFGNLGRSLALPLLCFSFAFALPLPCLCFVFASPSEWGPPLNYTDLWNIYGPVLYQILSPLLL